MDMSGKVQLAEVYFDQLEKERLQEHEEQEIMSAALKSKCPELVMEHMSTEPCLNHHREPFSTPNPDLAQSQGGEQERLLSDWKESWRNTPAFTTSSPSPTFKLSLPKRQDTSLV
jgi:hypothetical protein